MTAGVFPKDKKLVIYRGGGDSIRLTFTETATGDPIDLTGRSFVAQVRDRSEGPLLLDMTVTEVDLANGIIELSWLAADTAALPLRHSRWGVIDDTGVYWIDDACELKPKIPNE